MDVREVESLLENHVHNVGYDDDSGWWLWSEMAACGNGLTEVEGLGTVEIVKADTGGDGHGEHCEMVFQVSSVYFETRYFVKEGYYASYDGTSWDGDLYEAWPVVREVTFYEKKR